jgi:membrane protein DedA with SNARE-associated domain
MYTTRSLREARHFLQMDGSELALTTQAPFPWDALKALALLYVEESGLPLFLPGDVLVIYAGHRAAGDPVALAVAWLVAVLAVTLGATNLYLLARWLGRKLLSGRLGLMLHVTPERLDRAERAFRRWGPWALIFGRHVPGGRIPITIAAGILEVPYPLFAVCIAVSSGIWAAAWLAAGVAFGDQVAAVLDRYNFLGYIAVGVAVAATVIYFVVRWRTTARA